MKSPEAYADSKARKILETWWEQQQASGAKQADVAAYLGVGRNNMSHWFSKKSSENVRAGKASQVDPLPLDKARKLKVRFKSFPLAEYLAALYRYKKERDGFESDEMVSTYETTMMVTKEDLDIAKMAKSYRAILELAMDEERKHVSGFGFPRQLSDEQAERLRDVLRSIIDEYVEDYQLEFQAEKDVDTDEVDAKAKRIIAHMNAKRRIAKSWGLTWTR